MGNRLIPLLLTVAGIFPAAAADLLIGFEPGLPSPARAAALRHYGLTDVTATQTVTPRRVADRSAAGWQRLNRLMRDRGLARYVEPDGYHVCSGLPNDPFFTRQWSLRNTRFRTGKPGADINAVTAWRYPARGKPVIVAVIDTGVDYLHPDLRDAMWTNTGEIPGNGLDDDGNGYIDDIHGWNFYDNTADPMDITSHGTHCAGIIAASRDNNIGIAGISSDVRIMALRAASPWETLPWSATTAAIRYAADNGAHVINASWGGYGFSNAQAEAIAYAAGKGVLFVAAAGNYGNNNDRYPFYPAGYPLPTIISVAASDQFDRLAPWSNYGAGNTDLAAPGEKIFSTFAGGGYVAWGGTSMAAPHVCGAAALLLAYAPHLTPAATAALITATAVPLAYTGGRATGTANGRLNAGAALAAVPDTPSAIPAPVMAYLKRMIND